MYYMRILKISDAQKLFLWHSRSFVQRNKETIIDIYYPVNEKKKEMNHVSPHLKQLQFQMLKIL